MKSSIKIFISMIFLAAVCSECYAAASLPTPSTSGVNLQIPSTTTTQPLPADAGRLTGDANTIDLSGLSSNQPIQPENIDLTRGDALLETPDNMSSQIDSRMNSQQENVESPMNSISINDNLTEADINRYFDQILATNVTGSTGNPMRILMNRLPRYGMSFFNRPPSTYAPMDSVPVTQDYRIGVGDEVMLTLWGIPEEGNYRVIVNRDGLATIPHIGAIRLAGYNLAEAERIIQARLNQYYTGYQMNLSLGRLRSIMVYVTGNAARPGAYTVSSFATLVNALIASGGPSANGSLRKIELKRNGHTVARFDMYAMLLRGDKSQDARLQAGDVIYIPPVGPLVGLAGEVQRPGVYELNGTTRVKDLLYIAGGLNAQTFRGRIQFYRIYDHAYAGAFEGSLSEIEDTVLNDGDILRLYPVYNYTAMATITGPLNMPGRYIIIPGVTRVSDIIERAGGLTVTASEVAEITRVTPSTEGPVNERFTIDISQAMQGDPVNNMTLQPNDHITVLIIPDWKQQIRVSIAGEVRRPGVYSMFVGERLSDLITRAGGFTSKAFLRGSIFTRASVAAEQRRALNQMADRMERELLESMQNIASSSTGTANATSAFNAEYERRRQLINNLRTLDIMGRIITKIDTPKNIIGTPWDYELQDGDLLRIPETPLTVNVMGAVYTSSTQLYRPDMSINGYVNAAGGALKSAHKRMLYLLKSDGTTIRLTRSTAMLSSKKWTPPRGFSAKIEPGDTIVVPVKYLDRQSLESFKDAVDVIYKVAVAVGVIIDATD